MTKVPIDEIPAGREIDALVAERIIEYRCVCDEEPLVCPIHAMGDLDVLLPYSTDVGAAMAVLRQMRDLGFWWHIACHPLGIEITFFRFGAGSGSALVNGVGMLPLAICRAALKARQGSNWRWSKGGSITSIRAKRVVRDAEMRRALYDLLWLETSEGKGGCPRPFLSGAQLRLEFRRLFGD